MRITSISIIITGILFMSLPVVIAQQEEHTKLTFPYENKDMGIKMEYPPTDWTKYEYSQTEGIQAAVSENSTNNEKIIPIVDFCPNDEAKSTRPISPCIDPKVENVERLSIALHLLNKSDVSLDNFARKMINEHKTSLKGVKIVGYNKTTLAALPAYKIQYTVNWGTATSTKESNIIQKRIEFLVIKDGIGYDINYFADFSSPSDIQYPSSPAPVDVRNMVNSIQINKSNLSILSELNTRPSQLNTRPSQVGSSAGDSIIMTVNLQPHENEFLAKDGYYQVNTLDMNASKGSKLCPSGDCQYSIENAQFSPNTFTGGYVFEGLLKVSVVTDDTTSSMFFPMRADLDKISSQEKEGQTIEILQGSIKFGRNTISPEFEYKVENGTLLVDPTAPVLTLRGVKG